MISYQAAIESCRPRLSVSTSLDYTVPIDRQLALIAEAGFSHVSLGGQEAHSSYGSVEGRSRLKALLHQYDLAVDTIHGPQMDGDGSMEKLSDAADAAADLGARVVVVHAGPFEFQEGELPQRLSQTLEICEDLERIARAAGVLFGLENVAPGPATDLVEQSLACLDPQLFGLCYDSAHDQIGGPRPLDLLARWQERVVAVHLSDRVREFVDHVPPGEGFIDWAALVAALRGTTFAGPLLFEVMTIHSSEKDPRHLLQAVYKQGRWVHDLWQGVERPMPKAPA